MIDNQEVIEIPKCVSEIIEGKCTQFKTCKGWQNFVNQNVVNGIVREEQYLWVATEGGVVKWDLINNTYKSFTVSDGLADNWVLTIGIDNNKNKWFGTYEGGLDKFDGKHWENYSHKNGLRAKSVLTLFIDPQGGVWCGTDSGVYKFDGKKWTCPREYLFLKKKPISSICIDNDGAFWFGLRTYGLVRVFKGKRKFFDILNNIPGNMVNDIALDKDNAVWIATHRGVFIFDGEKFTHQTIGDYNNETKECCVTSVVLDKNRVMWCGSDGGCVSDDNMNMWLGGMGKGALAFSNGQWNNFDMSKGIIHNTVRTIFVDEDNNKWFGTDEGITKFDGQKMTQYITQKEGIATNRVLSIAIDKDNKRWFGTARRGVCALDNDNWISYGNKENTEANNAQVVVVDSKDGNLWAGTAVGVLNFDGGVWKSYTESDGLAHNYVSDIFIDKKGNKWFATRGGGVSKFDSNGWTTYNSQTVTPEIFKSDVIRALFVDDNQMWFGTYGGGAIHFDGAQWKNYTSEDGLAGDEVFEIYVDKGKRVWFGTNRGVSILDKGKWTNIVSSRNSLWCLCKSIVKEKQWLVLIKYLFKTKWKIEINLAGDHIWDMAVDKMGNIWFAALGGISRYDGKGWKKYTMSDGVCNHNVRAIAVDEKDNIWIGTVGGVSKFVNGEE